MSAAVANPIEMDTKARVKALYYIMQSMEVSSWQSKKLQHDPFHASQHIAEEQPLQYIIHSCCRCEHPVAKMFVLKESELL